MDVFDCVLAVAEYKNVTKAAEHIFMTQPALTLRISRLEKELGVKLFDRSKNPIQITPAGHFYITEMQKIRQAEGQLLSHLRDMGGQKHSHITIGMGFNRGKVWYPILLPLLQEKNPGLTIQTHEASDNEQESLVLLGAIDIGVIGSAVISPKVSTFTLGQEEIFFGIPAQSDLTAQGLIKTVDGDPRKYVDPSIFNNQTFIMGRESYGLTKFARLLFSYYKIQPKEIINVGNSETAYLLCASGMGIVLTMADLNYFPLPGKKMQRPILSSLEGRPLYRDVSLIYKKERENDPLIGKVREQVKEFFLMQESNNSPQ